MQRIPGCRSVMPVSLKQAGQMAWDVSVMSCWETADYGGRGRLELPKPLAVWMKEALAYPGVRLIELTPGDFAIEATRLPPPFHRDPVDQILGGLPRVLLKVELPSLWTA
jgi:PIN domain nuclease of toxin-antitoxin system